MKKRFTLEVMYGDDDYCETFRRITENENEINFLAYFLENYTDDLFNFYDRADLYYCESFKGNEERLIEIVNSLNSLASKLHNEETELLSKNASESEIHKVLSKVIWVVEEYIGWIMYCPEMDCHGHPQSYEIEDITDCIEMTKKEVIEMMKNRLGINVVITD